VELGIVTTLLTAVLVARARSARARHWTPTMAVCGCGFGRSGLGALPLGLRHSAISLQVLHLPHPRARSASYTAACQKSKPISINCCRSSAKCSN
jgi:hypothetical protein